MELSSGGCEDLFCGALAGADGGVDRSPVAGDVGVLSGEIEGIFDGGSQLEDSV
jgi:hypothetical protein